MLKIDREQRRKLLEKLDSLMMLSQLAVVHQPAISIMFVVER